MRSNSQSAQIRTLPTAGRVRDLPLESGIWQLAHDAFVQEDYETALTKIRHALNTVPSHEGRPVVPVPEPGVPTVKDGVVLCARCLFQLDRYEEFEVLQASAGRWDLVPERMPDLDVVHLAFACKQGHYGRVVTEATEFIKTHRQDLPPVIAHFLHLRGFAYSHLGRPDHAREDIEAAYSLFKVLGEHLDGSRAANLMGILNLREGRFSSAEQWFRRALAGHTRLGMLKNMGGNHLNLGITSYKLGDLGQAMVEFEAASGLLKSVDAQVSLCRLDIARGNTLRLLRLPAEVKQALAQGAIREGHARALLALPTPEAQVAALKTVTTKALSVRQTEELVRRLLAEPQPQKPKSRTNPENEALELEFRDTLGTKVDLYRSRKGRGRLVIHFYSEEELQTIYDIIVGGG